MVNLLHSLGVKFSTVIGHSSGEIVAAYAAGYLSSTNALRIAYYRGFHAKLSGGPNGEKGAMMAVGSSFSEAQEFIKANGMQSRIAVAANNSSASVTLSGDIVSTTLRI
jgi:hybrid polyketide synthase/nonribosomal peptide synthetase ACE1